MREQFSRRRSGVSLVEVLVVAGVLCLLAGLLLPAVQKARSAALAARCRNNLKQIGVAVHGFEAERGWFPVAFCGHSSSLNRSYCFSPLTKILPHLGEAAVHAMIDWRDDTLDFQGAPPMASPANGPLLDQPVAALVCPADGEAAGGASSYRISTGRDMAAASGIAPFDPMPYRFARIADGLSSTALYSERLVGANAGGLRNPLNIASTTAALAESCVEAQVPATPVNPGDMYAGRTWLRGGVRHAQYSHVFPPNARLRDCNGGDVAGAGLMAARSSHAGGVHVLFADGHTVLVADALSIAAWRAMGTPNGGEAAAD